MNFFKGIDLSPDVIVRLADHPNVIGIKDSGGDVSILSGTVVAKQAVQLK